MSRSTRKAQPAVVLVLISLRRRGHGLKSHPTYWESRELNSGLLGTRGVTHYITAARYMNVNLIEKYITVKESKGAKIRNRYNQVPHLTQDTNGKVTNSR